MNLNVVVANNKSLVSAAIGACALKYATNNMGNYFLWRGYKINTLILGSFLGGFGSYATDGLSRMVLPHISKSVKLQHLESIVLHVFTSASLFSVIPKLLNSDIDSADMKKLAIAGVVTELASQFIHELTCREVNVHQGAVGCNDGVIF